ncbi:MAG: lysylphosphatidylglycerol synthase transmembrane domain-containing protein [Thermoplasmata archaeon]
MDRKISDKLKQAIKVVLSLSLIIYVIYSAGPYKILAQLKGVILYLFMITVLLGVFRIAISAKKWQILLQAKKIHVDYLDVLKLYYIGNFFNMFLPTNVGGDVIKAHKMSKRAEKKVEAYSSVFMERFVGVIALLSLTIVSSIIYFQNLPKVILILIFAVILPTVLIGTILMFNTTAANKFERFLHRILGTHNPFSIKEKLTKLYRSILEYRYKKKALLLSLIISFIFHTILVVTNYILALSLNFYVPIQYFFIFVPLTSMILFLPISIRGFGAREALYMFFFATVGVSASQAVSLSFLVQLLSIIGSLLGGFIYLFSKEKI